MTTVSSPVPQVSSDNDKSKGNYETLDWEETSLTHLPKGWSRFYRETAIFLRSIGLGIIIAIWEGTFKSDFTEPKKIAVSRSRVRSLLNCLIHVIPVGFALFELVAKAHEILIDASLASIVLSYIRRETALHDGLPFGAFLGGLQFLSVSYLWSRELWSSVFSTSWRLRNRATFVFLIMVSGIIAATAGPASATLLIPRELLWRLPSTYSVVNATTQELWPTKLDQAQVPRECSILNETASNPLCLAASWQDIYKQVYVDTSLQGRYYDEPNDIYTGIVYSVDAPPSGIISAEYANCPFNGISTSSTQICGGTQANILQEAAFSNNYDPAVFTASYLDLYHRVDTPIYSAYTAVRCFADTIHGPEDNSPFQFSSLSRNAKEYERVPVEIAVETPSKAEVYATSHRNLSEFHLLWIDLPEELFGQTTSGAILLNPRSLDANSYQNVTTCTVSAGWGRSAMLADQNVIDRSYFFPVEVPTSLNGFINKVALGTAESWVAPFWANVSGDSFPQKLVKMPVDWLAYLNPTLEFSDGSNSTAINKYLSPFPQDSREAGVSKVITMMLDIGLSTIGQDLPWERLPNGPLHCDDECQVIETKHLYQGWAYTSQGTSVKLALIVLMAYCALAIAHMVYLAKTGISSDAWDSTAELLALAINSPPTHHLQNTCSGIFGMKTFRTRVRILATAERSSQQKDHLELVFREASEATVPEVKMLLNEEYGRLPPNGCWGCGCCKDRQL